jgi:hypothetical protein
MPLAWQIAADRLTVMAPGVITDDGEQADAVIARVLFCWQRDIGPRHL